MTDKGLDPTIIYRKKGTNQLFRLRSTDDHAVASLAGINVKLARKVGVKQLAVDYFKGLIWATSK